MLLDLWPTQTTAPAGQGGGASGNDFTPTQVRRALQRARSTPVVGFNTPSYQAQPVPAGLDPDVAVVLYELGEIDELELASLLAR